MMPPGALTPALLNSTSTRPKASFVFANRFATEALSVTSVGTDRTWDAGTPDSAAVSSSASLRRPASTVR
ncbi:hypothetical protein D3C72_2532640 [compost metagenome]